MGESHFFPYGFEYSIRQSYRHTFLFNFVLIISRDLAQNSKMSLHDKATALTNEEMEKQRDKTIHGMKGRDRMGANPIQVLRV